jgi:hypothetical protein
MGNFRASIKMVIVEDWAQLMDLMLRTDDYEVMKPKRYEGKDLKYCTELCSSTRA